MFFSLFTCSFVVSTHVNLASHDSCVWRIGAQCELCTWKTRSIPPVISIRVVDFHCIEAVAWLPTIHTLTSNTSCRKKVMNILHSGLICIETCKLTEKMILPITKISLLSTTALQRYLEYFMGHNSVHLFVFGSYSRSRLLRRSGSSSNRYDWMVDGEGGNDKAEQLLSGSHTDTVRAHIKCAHEVLFSLFHKIQMKHWLIKQSRSPVGFDRPSRKGNLSFWPRCDRPKAEAGVLHCARVHLVETIAPHS